MTTNTIEKLTSMMVQTMQELEKLTGNAPQDRASTAELVINLTSSFMLSHLERAEMEYPGLSAELLARFHEITKPDSPLAKRLEWIHKRQ